MNRNDWSMSMVSLPAEADAGDKSSDKPRRGRPPGSKSKKKGKIGKARAVAVLVEQMGPDTPNETIQERLKKDFKITLKLTNVSQYKSNYLKHLRDGGAPATLEPLAAPAKRVKAVATIPSGDTTIEEIRALKALVGRMGRSRLLELIELIGG